MFGPPGAGKGTQSENLVRDFNLFKVSTGDLLREEVKSKSSLGIKIKDIIDKGEKTLYLAIYNSSNQRSYITVKLK